MKMKDHCQNTMLEMHLYRNYEVLTLCKSHSSFLFQGHILYTNQSIIILLFFFLFTPSLAFIGHILELFVLSSLILLSYISNCITLCCIPGNFFPLVSKSLIFTSSVFWFSLHLSLQLQWTYFSSLWFLLGLFLYPCLFSNCLLFIIALLIYPAI